jgi:hypothetical protein
MSNLNRYWIILIIVGVIALIAVVGWDVYQITTGNRSEVNYTVIGFEEDSLLPESLETHLKESSLYGEFVPTTEK